MHIGLIGGIGPAATVSYYTRLVARMREFGRPLELTIVQADVNDLIANNIADDREAQARIYARLIDRLKAAGAECAAITSFGGHFCFAETQRIASLPLVSALAPLDDFFVSQGLSRVGLLGTSVVMRTRFYGQLHRTTAVACDDDIERLSALYDAIALSGACTEEQREAFYAAGQRMVAEQGAEAIVLAGTDMNIAFNGVRDPGYRVVDALDVHVAVLADLASGRTTVSDHRAGAPTP